MMNARIITGDCIAELPKLSGVNLVFADPPYNQGVDYGRGSRADKLPSKDYALWTNEWVAAAVDTLCPNGCVWVVCPDEWVSYTNYTLSALGLHRRNWIKWHETFGNNCSQKFSRTSRHLLHYVKDPKNFTFNADAVRVPSARQAKYNDKRACPKGKVPGDVWEIPRVCGTYKERVPGVPTQLPLALVERVVLACSSPGDLVVDPFCGSGTTGVAAVKHGRRFIGIDCNGDYCKIAEARISQPVPTNGRSSI